MSDYKKEIMEEAAVNPSYDTSLPIEDRIRDFLGAYHIERNGVRSHEPFYLVNEGKPNERCDQEAKEEIINFLSQALTRIEEETRKEEITENTSDGYHSFKELYEFRKLYNAALFNEWQKEGKYMVHKSKRHSDGELCFGGGWFIVMAQLPTGQISNHYELKDWDLFQIDELERAAKWDGHTAQDVAKRLEALLSPSEEKEESGEKERYYWDICPQCGNGHNVKFNCSPKKEKRGR